MLMRDVELPTTKDVTVRTAIGEIVARMTLRAGVLHGRCDWYDGQGRLIAHGVFDTGVPRDGAVLNWARYFPEFDRTTPFDPDVYCRDWVSPFEAGYLSQSPDYPMVMETYANGARMPPPMAAESAKGM